MYEPTVFVRLKRACCHGGRSFEVGEILEVNKTDARALLRTRADLVQPTRSQSLDSLTKAIASVLTAHGFTAEPAAIAHLAASATETANVKTKAK